MFLRKILCILYQNLANMERLKKTLEEKDKEDKLRRRIYYQKNKEKLLAYSNKWNNANREKSYRDTYNNHKKRLRNDELYRFNKHFTVYLGASFREKKPVGDIEQLLGCTWAYFRQHIENQFEPWMTWENKGNWNKTPDNPQGTPKKRNTCWDIDHNISIQAADTIEQAKKLHHYKNLRPLCSIENRWPSRPKY